MVTDVFSCDRKEVTSYNYRKFTLDIYHNLASRYYCRYYCPLAGHFPPTCSNIEDLLSLRMWKGPCSSLHDIDRLSARSLSVLYIAALLAGIKARPTEHKVSNNIITDKYTIGYTLQSYPCNVTLLPDALSRCRAELVKYSPSGPKLIPSGQRINSSSQTTLVMVMPPSEVGVARAMEDCSRAVIQTLPILSVVIPSVTGLSSETTLTAAEHVSSSANKIH